MIKITNELMDQIKTEMENVPFENSVYQIRTFTPGLETPERRYRYILLQLWEAFNAMKECYFIRENLQIDIEELEEKLKKEKDKFKRRRFEVSIQEKQWKLDNQIKLINDKGIQIQAWIQEWETLPKCDRKQFELGEPTYWKTRLVNEAINEIKCESRIAIGTYQSIEQMGIKVSRTADGIIHFDDSKLLENKVKDNA